jgi:hypothetical protein
MNLIQHKYFVGKLNEYSKTIILKDIEEGIWIVLAHIIEEVIKQEKKMQESLKRFSQKKSELDNNG